jgi:hypothetical protein
MKTLDIEKKLNEFIEMAPFSEYKFPDNHKIQLSEGCKYILENCNAEWLFNMILFYQLEKKKFNLSMLVWTVSKLPDGRTRISCEDEHEEHMFGQSSSGVYFPWDEKKFVVNDDYVAIYDEIYYEPE